jgi:hypothetical protein
MHARALQEAETSLAGLRHDEEDQLVLGLFALTAALMTTAVYEPLVMPLFLGGLALWILGIRSLWRRWDLVDRLADDPEAYAIPAVRAYAARDAQMERRRVNATSLRHWASGSLDPSLVEVAEELEQLARDLGNADLELAPASAIACRRLLTDPTASPLLTSAPVEEIHARIAQIEAGFTSAERNARV